MKYSLKETKLQEITYYLTPLDQEDGRAIEMTLQNGRSFRIEDIQQHWHSFILPTDSFTLEELWDIRHEIRRRFLDEKADEKRTAEFMQNKTLICMIDAYSTVSNPFSVKYERVPAVTALSGDFIVIRTDTNEITRRFSIPAFRSHVVSATRD